MPTASKRPESDETQENRGLVGRVGPLEVDWPRSIGYFGGVGLAVAFGVIEAPLGIFIAAVPFFKLLNRPRAPRSVRVASQLLDGASKPVGGDASVNEEQGFILRLKTPNLPHPPLK
jgi:hypothetical protein